MRSKKLVLLMVAPACMVLCSMVSAAPKVVAKKTAPAAKATAAKAAKPKVAVAKKFSQQAEMDKFWSSPDSTVVGKVSGVNVTKGELVEELWDRTAPNMLSELLDQKMIEQAAKKANVTVTNADVEEQVKETLARLQIPNKEALMAQYKVTNKRFIETLRIQALMKKMSLKKTKVDPAEYAQYMKASHILIRFPQDIADKTQQEAAAKTKIDEINAKIKANPQDFAKIANEVSEDPGSKENGGSLGWFSKGKMMPEFEQAAFELKAGQISEPVKSPYGFHIIKAEAIGKDATGAAQADLKKMIIDTKAPMEMGKLLTDIRNESAKTRIDKINTPVDPNAMPTMGGPGGPGGPNAPRPAARPRPTPPPAPSDKPDAPPAPPAQ